MLFVFHYSLSLIFFLFFNLTFYHLINIIYSFFYHLYIRYIFVIQIINATSFNTPSNHLKNLYATNSSENSKNEIFSETIHKEGEKKGVDRSSTVVLRDPANEGELDFICLTVFVHYYCKLYIGIKTSLDYGRFCMKKYSNSGKNMNKKVW